jgi:8-oxo-dGTP pyrophosphatase MutT (NUDIX family)
MARQGRAICMVPRITSLASADARLTRRSWGFASVQIGAIDAYWDRRTAEQPRLFNGAVLILDRWIVRHGHFSGECITTDFKSFLYWREHDAPDHEVFDFFATGALHTSEGWLILGRAGAAMSNAGKVYPPSGSLHADQFGHIDLDESIVREIREETGIEVTRAQLGSMLLIEACPQIVIVRPIKTGRPSAEIVAKIEGYLRSNPSSELSNVVVVRGLADIQAGVMPPFTIAYIEHAFQR